MNPSQLPNMNKDPKTSSKSPRFTQGSLAATLRHAPNPFPAVHHAPIGGNAKSKSSPIQRVSAMPSTESMQDPIAMETDFKKSTIELNPPLHEQAATSPIHPAYISPLTMPSHFKKDGGSPVDDNSSGHQESTPTNPSSLWYHRPVQPSAIGNTSTSTKATQSTSLGLLASGLEVRRNSALPLTLAPSLLTAPLTSIPLPRIENDSTLGNGPRLSTRNSIAGSTSFPGASSHPNHTSHSQQTQDNPAHYNPYRAPSQNNSCAFIPPNIPGYDFKSGSQAGNMGLMIGKRLSDGLLVTGKLLQSRVLLQHEHRILKRLQIADGRYEPSGAPAPEFDASAIPQPGPSSKPEPESESGISMDPEQQTIQGATASSHCHATPGVAQAVYETGFVEKEKYFNRIVEDFLDLEQEDMSILILKRLGPNILSHHHHRFLGLYESDGFEPELASKTLVGSPFPNIYVFLVFCLKAACILEALQRSNLAHLALCPTALHWEPPPEPVVDSHEKQEVGDRNPYNLFHDAGPNSGPAFPGLAPEQHQSNHGPLERPAQRLSSSFGSENPFQPHWDVNETKLRLFDFTHSKILSHERARAPNNIFEWQIPGYLEYHLQYLAPEQTGRAETWMDHRTDIYGLGATLFSLLTMQFPNKGNDSVQILQGVLSRDLPPLQIFRPEMPPIIDDILRKMTQKQPSQRYQSAFGFKQDILKCLNELNRTGTIGSFTLGSHDISFQFVLPNAIFGRQVEQQIISTAIVQASTAYQQSSRIEPHEHSQEPEEENVPIAPVQDSDHYVFEDDIVSLPTQNSTKISLSSKALLRTPKPFDGGKLASRGIENADPVVRVIFVSGPSGVGKTSMIRGIAATARNSGLFASGVFEAESSQPYSAILSCVQSVIQQLLTQHTDALASLVVTVRTAFEQNSGIGIICDLVPELKYFFNGSEMPESKDIPLTHSVARFHALILKLIRVISTHFFMTWLIDDIHFADENSIALLATLVNVNKRLPIVLIMTHRDTPGCLIKVKQILGGSGLGGSNLEVNQDSTAEDLSTGGATHVSSASMAKAAASKATGLPLMVRGGGGVRTIRLQNPQLDTIQDFLAALLHRDKADVVPLAQVLHSKSWLTIRQLVLELYRNETIFFNCFSRVWEWEPDSQALAQGVRKLTGEEYAFLESRFRALDCEVKKTLICASICGSVFSIADLQHLVSKAYSGTNFKNKTCCPEQAVSAPAPSTSNEGAMAGLQTALREGILVYTCNPDLLRFQHTIMRRVAIKLLEGTEETERLHYEMTKILIKNPGSELRTASHVLHCLGLIKKKMAANELSMGFTTSDGSRNGDTDELDTHSLRTILSLAGERSQKSGAQDMAMAYWNAALSLLPDDCWDPPATVDSTDSDSDIVMEDVSNDRSTKTTLYNEALKLHLQCIEAERWRESFDRAMKMCDFVLTKTTDPIDRARVFQHQIEMFVWAYSLPAQAAQISIQCLQELGMPKDIDFNPTQAQIRTMYDETHLMLLEHMKDLEAEDAKVCTNDRINMTMEVLSIANASLYYQNLPFLATGIALSMKLVCEYGITKDVGRALVCFALTHSTWHGCLENAYELGLLASKVNKDNQHVKFLFHLTVQQWGDHIANSIPALEETLAAADMASDRLFHTAGMIHVSVMRVLLGRVHLSDCLSTTMELVNKHIEFGPKSHGVEVCLGIVQLIKCLKGQTLASSPETMFDDAGFLESKMHGKRDKKLIMVHNNSTYTLLKIVAAFIYGHFPYIEEVTSSWHDDPKSMMNFEGSWISHSIFTVVGLTLVNLLRTEEDPEVREKFQGRLFVIRRRMEERANKFPTNHAAMFHLLEAEIADQEGNLDMKKTMLLYEKAIWYATEGDFPLHKCFSYELAARYHRRHGLVTSAKCLMANACKGYQTWGARGKVQWFYRTYPDVFGLHPEADIAGATRGLFYRPTDHDSLPAGYSIGAGTLGSSTGSAAGGPSSATNTSPWMSASPAMYSPSLYGNDAVSAAAAAIAESAMTASSSQSGPPSSGSASSSTPNQHTAPTTVHSTQSSNSSGNPLHHNWVASPQTPELDNADLDVLDFSSVIEAMQVIASEIDLDLLLVKSLGVLNQSVGAKRCCVIISKDQELVLAASQGDLGRCESVDPPMEVAKCNSLFHGVINYVINTSTPCLLTNAKDDPRFCSDDYLKQRTELKTVLCAPILHKAAMVGVLYMEEFPERAFANKRMLVMNLLVQQLGISITNALLYQSVLRSETKLNGLLENMPCGIALWDATAENCQYINSSWKDMTGYTLDEIMDSGWAILTHEDEQAIYIEHWRERVLAGVPCQWESRYRLKDGTFRWGIVRMLPIMSPSEKKVIQWLTVTIDIDDQRRAVQLKSNFLANMSHELRTPFSGILGMLSLLRDSSGLSHEQFEFVDMAKASCEMLIRIVDDLLNFSKLEADKVTLEYIPMCFEEILGDVCDLLVPLASRKGLELIILIDETMPIMLIGDPDRMKQILMNLIGNSIKFSTKGNVVIEFWHTVSQKDPALAVMDPSSALRSTRKFLTSTEINMNEGTSGKDRLLEESRLGNEVVLHCAVKDQGIGLSPEEQKMLFVSFQQTDNGTTRKYGGTGLGLSIVAQLIAHMHGKITVDSQKGQGSTFSFTAKLRTITAADQEQSPAETARILECDRVLLARLEVIKGKRILVLSPNRLLREQIVRTLEGAICMEFDDVASAVESRVIGMSGLQQMDLDSELSGTVVSDQGAGPTTSPSLSLSSMSGTKEEEILQFDFILVDHVLDSAELDCIFPSPTVAFVLLLAPTTETLRWILPPATKPMSEEPEEPDSGQIDIGGRGRVQRRDPESVDTLDTSNKLVGVRKPRLSSIPSELFKKRKKSMGHVTVARQGLEESGELDGTGGVMAEEGLRMGLKKKEEAALFQVCRLIKPVRRMKLLQILYNALNQQVGHGEAHASRLWESRGVKEQGLSSSEEEEEVEDGYSSVSRSTSPMSVVSTPGIATGLSFSGSSLKRRRGQETVEVGTGGVLTGRRRRLLNESGQSRVKRPLVSGMMSGSISPSSLAGETESLSSSSSASGSKSRRAGVAAPASRAAVTAVEDGNLPKRARNNDALTLLLSHEERRRCRGKNVLVAEDDFVSQKILEKQLSKLGMNVMIANNGQEAVNQWLAAEKGFYTIAIFDHHMPIMDGLAATKKLRALELELAQEQQTKGAEGGNENLKDDVDAAVGAGGEGSRPVVRIPIVGLSADIQQSTKESCIKAGMDEYMTKPLLTKGLALLIQRYCCN